MWLCNIRSTLLGVCNARSIVHVVVQSSLSRFDITEYHYTTTKTMKPWKLCLHCPISVLIVTSCSCSCIEQWLQLVPFNDIQAHIQGWISNLERDINFVLLCVLHTPCNVLLVIFSMNVVYRLLHGILHEESPGVYKRWLISMHGIAW